MKFSEALEVLETFLENDKFYGDYCVPVENDVVILDKPFLEVQRNQTPIYVTTGTYCYRGTDGHYEPDWALTWVWEDLYHPENYMYFEQDGPLITLANLFTDDYEDIKSWNTEILFSVSPLIC